jgi:serine phosphatase RsbU (regulator of sigma subunit)
MDSILLLSPDTTKLEKFLGKLGYQVRLPKTDYPIKDMLSKELLDLVLLDTAYETDAVELVQFLRGMDTTKQVPIVLLGTDKVKQYAIKELELERIEIVPTPFSVGTIATRVATNLRLRKMAGESSISATLSEANAALRDLNAKFKRDIDQARLIQQSLLPATLPKNEYVEFASVYQPLEEVGGDWYFISQRADGKISTQLADVTGHGLAAALIGSMTKLALSAGYKEKPNEQLKETNKLIAPQMPQGTFITMANFVYDPKSGDIEFARAGHPPALILRSKEKTVSQLAGQGFAIGFFEDGDYQLLTDKLQENDLLVLYTDGITEAQNRNGDQYGIEGLSASLLSIPAETSAQDVSKHVMTNFKKFCDGRLLKDDVTLLVIKRLK